MRIGILSDTHGHLDPLVFQYLEPCDEIWHAGDIGQFGILEKLQAFRPTISVYGNIDDHLIRSAVPENQMLSRGGVRILITHIAGKPPGYNSRVKRLIQTERPNLLVCGHSHILKVQYDPTNKLLYLNPGAAGNHGFHQVKTLLRLEIKEGKAQNLEVVELGKRGKV